MSTGGRNGCARPATILGHKVGRNVERAYQRSDLLQRRRVLLQRWTDYLLGAPPGGGA